MSVTLLPVEPELHAGVQARYRASPPGSVSFVDRVSFAVIERDQIDVAFTTDPDFDVTGVPIIPSVD